MGGGETIRVRVLCFSHVRAVLGRDELDMELPAGSTAGDVAARVIEMGAEKLRGLPVKIALNESFVEPDTAVTDGDELALIPPVQGGSACGGERSRGAGG